MCFRKGFGVAKSDAEAAKWFRKAADQGNADAQCHLGKMYTEGRGVVQSDEEGERWFKLAAEQGNFEAQFNLGEDYLDPDLWDFY